MTQTTELRQAEKPSQTLLLPLQGLRTLAFAAIFLSHTGIGYLGALGAWGVSVFFVLSGVVMLYSYYNRGTPDPAFGIPFAYQKIKKLYPLHIATMAVCALYEIYAILLGNGNILHLLRNLFLHITLIQIWIPNQAYYQTLNGLAWYLAVCAVLYFAFPLLLRLMRRQTKRSCSVLLLSLFALQILVSIVAFCFGSKDKSAWFSMQWITYYFPLSRLLDFAIGSCLAWLFLHTERQTPKKLVSSCLEAAVLAGIIVSWVIYAKGYPILGEEYLKYALLFTPTTVPLIWLTARGVGLFSGFLSRKPLVRFADLTPYTFLIHGVVLKYCRLIIGKLMNNSYIIAAAALAITIVAAYIWIAISKKIRCVRQNHKSLGG